jgi:sporulation protein YlmC with PRC-barrel domain
MMRIGSAIAAIAAIMLIAAAADTVRGGYWSLGGAERLARPAQPRELAQAAEPPAPAVQSGRESPAVPPPSPGTAPANPPAGTAPANPGTPAVVLDDQEVSAILGKGVRSNAGEDMGRIVDVIVNGDGQVRAAIIDFGGFLGIGTRKIAVDWRALNFAPAGKPGAITLELTRNQVRLAPEYKRGEPVVVVGPAGGERTVPSSEAAAPER